MLASNCFQTHNSTLNHYESATQAKPQEVDLVLSELPPNTNKETLKQIAGSKHIYDVVVDQDNLKGTASGTGRMKIRLNHGESADMVKLNFLRQGINVQDHS